MQMVLKAWWDHPALACLHAALARHAQHLRLALGVKVHRLKRAQQAHQAHRFEQE